MGMEWHGMAGCDGMDWLMWRLWSKANLHSCSVQFKVALVCIGNPICTPPCTSAVFPVLPIKQFQCWSHWRRPFLTLSRKIVKRFAFLCLCPLCDRWCDVLIFVPAGRVSSPSTLKHFSTVTLAFTKACAWILHYELLPWCSTLQHNVPVCLSLKES